MKHSLIEPLEARIAPAHFTITASARVPEGNAGNTDLSFTVTLSEAQVEAVTVDFATEDGTATLADGDYLAASGTLTFAPGELEKEILVSAVGDFRGEGDETFSVKLLAPSAGHDLGAVSTGVGTIADDDRPSISIGGANGLENGAVPADPSTLSFLVSLAHASDEQITVQVTSADQTAAVADGDYTAVSELLTFAPGETTKTVTVTLGKDTKYEADETFRLLLSSPVNASLSGDGTAIGNILNDDARPVISVSSTSSLENGTSASDPSTQSFTVSLSNPSYETVSVTFKTVDGTATSADGDYVAKTQVLTFAPGETVRTVTVTLGKDTKFEPDESFQVQLSGPGNATLGTASGTGTILNDDGQPTVSIFNASTVEGNPGAPGTVTFEVRLSNPSYQTVTVMAGTVSGGGDTAVAGLDYTATSGVALSFAPGETVKTFTVPLIGDWLDEADETFTVQLSGATNATLDAATATGTILNDELRVRVGDVSVLEGAGVAEFEVKLSTASSHTVFLSYGTADGTALAGGDYSATSGVLTFLPGVTSQKVPVNLLNDGVGELGESFKLQLSGVSGALLSNSEATATILDDDAAFVIDDVQVVEGGAGGTSLAVFKVSLLNAASGKTYTVDLATSDQTATAAGDDYTAKTGTLTFTSAATPQPSFSTLTQTFSVVIKGDTAVEANETFRVTLSNALELVDGGGNVAGPAIARAQAVGTVLNDDGATDQLVFTIGDVTITEGDSGSANALFVVRLVAGTTGQGATLSYATADGTATSSGAGADFTHTAGTLTFASGTTQQVIKVPILGDLTKENAETFAVKLLGATFASGSGSATFLRDTATGTILDNNDSAPLVTISPASLAEGAAGSTGMMHFEVNLSKAASELVTVTYTTQDGTAQQGSDFVAPTDGFITFEPGQTKAVISVPVTGDDNDEADETFTVQLSGATGAALGAMTSAVGTIQNDDLELSVENVTIFEGNSGTTTLVFQVSLSHSPAGHDVQVSFATQDGTAISTGAGADYVAKSGVLTFAAGTSTLTQNVAVTINSDTRYELDEEFLLKLFAPANAVLAAGKDQAAGTITNEDIAPKVSILDATLTEGAPGTPKEMSFTLQLDKASDVPVSVLVSSADGAALAGEDYTAVSGETVTFAPGQTSAVFTVSVLGDSRDEPSESFLLNLSGPDNASLDRTQATGTILDDDARSVRISGGSIVEGGSADGPHYLTFTVSLSAAAEQTVTVQVSTADGSALSTGANKDFVAASQTLTFAPGEVAKTFQVQVLGDETVEANEQFTVALSNPGNAVLGTAASAKGVIVNDETLIKLVPVGSLNIAEEDGTTQSFMEFQVIREGDLSQQATVQYSTIDGSAVGTGAQRDFNSLTGTLTFAAGSASAGLIRVAIAKDSNYETNEQFGVNLFNPVNAAILDGGGAALETLQTVTILDNDQAPTISIANQQITEGNSEKTMTFTVRLSAANERETVTIDYLVGDDTDPLATSARAAASGGFLQDYEVEDGLQGTLTFLPGEVEKTISVTVFGDLRDEADAETFLVTLSNQKNGTVSVAPGADWTAKGTILDNDAAPLINFKGVIGGKVEHDEGNFGTTQVAFTLELSEISEREVSVVVASLDQTASSSGMAADYLALPSGFTVHFVPGEKQASFSVQVFGDELHEADETFNVSLSGPENARLNPVASAVQVELADNDAAPFITVNDVSVAEGDSGLSELVFTVSRSSLSGLPVSVDFKTVDGTASAKGLLADYLAQGGTITFGADELSREVRIQIVGDIYKEGAETFSLQLSNAKNGQIVSGGGVGTGTILADDDSVVGMTITDAFIREGDGELDTLGRPLFFATFTVELTSALDAQTLFKVNTRSGTAVRGVDFEDVVGRSVTIAEGQKTAQVRIGMKGEGVFEPTESFFVDVRDVSAGIEVVDGTARGTIYNDDLLQVNARTIKFIDVDGDLVKVKVSKGALSASRLSFGSVNSLGGRQLRSINLIDSTGQFQGADLSVIAVPQEGFPGSPEGKASNGRVNVGSIIAADPQDQIQQFVNGSDLGRVKIDGDLGKIIVGDNFATAAVSSLEVLSLGKQGTSTQEAGSSDTSGYDVVSRVLGPITSVNVTGDFCGRMDLIGAQYGRIDHLYIGGALTGGASGDGGQILFTGAIRDGYIGQIAGAEGTNSGLVNGTTFQSKIINLQIGSVVGGSGSGSGQLYAAKIQSMVVGQIRGGEGAQSGRILSNNLQSVVVNQGITGGAGSESGTLLGDTIGSLVVKGAVRGGSATASGAIVSSGSIGSASVKGGIIGGGGLLAGSIRTGGGVGSLSVGKITGAEGEKSGSLQIGGAVDSLRVRGDILGGAGPGSGGVEIGGKLADAVFGGSIVGGDSQAATSDHAELSLTKSGYVVARKIGSLYLDGDLVAGENLGSGLALSGTIRSQTTIGYLRIHGSVLGNEGVAAIIAAPGASGKATAIRSVLIDGDAKFAEILAGYDADATAASVRGTEVNADAGIGTVQVGGTLKSSSIVAGVSAGDDGLFGSADDHLIGGGGVIDVAATYSRIAKIIVGGAGSGSVSAGIIAQELGSVQVAGAGFPLFAGAGNDTTRTQELAPGSKVQVFEVPLPV